MELSTYRLSGDIIIVYANVGHGVSKFGFKLILDQEDDIVYSFEKHSYKKASLSISKQAAKW